VWGSARQPLPSSNSTTTTKPTTSSSGQPIRFNLQFQKQQKAKPTPPPPTPTVPQSIPLPGQSGQSSLTSEASKNPTPGMSEWPESLRRYVTQCFSRCQTEIDKDQTEIILKGKLTRAFSDGSAFTVDWDNEPLPTLHSDKLKQQQQQQNQQSSLNNHAGQTPANNSNKNSSYDPMSLFRGRDKSGKKQKQQQQPQQPQQQQQAQERKPMTVFSRLHGNDRDRSRSRSRSPSSEDRKRTPRGRRNHFDGSGSTGSGSPSSEDEESARGASSRGGRFGGRGGKRDKDDGKNNKRRSNNFDNNNGNKKHKGKQIGNAPEEDPTLKEARLAKRAARFQDHLNDASSDSSSLPVSFGKKAKKQKGGSVRSRLSLGGLGSVAKNQGWNLNSFAFAMGGDEGEIDWSSFAIKGTSATVEKKYLRLTAAPDPATVRPPSVLRKALELAKKNWLEHGDYHATCDAFKSIRQDLTVQCIRDAFTVQVYETHARVAIEKRDKEEFNMCLTQLKLLHKTHPSQYTNEFAAYRLLYYIFTNNTLDVGVFMASLTPELKRDPCIEHALTVRKAWSSGNYVRFFRLYANAPNMSSALMDFFIERERKEAFGRAVKSYRPSMSVEQLKTLLAFEEISEVREFLEQVIGDKVVYADRPQNEKIDCKATSAAVAL